VSLARGESVSAADLFAIVAGEFMVALGVWFFWRALLVRIIADDNGLTVVNYAKTLHLPWADIRSFEVGGGYWGIGARLGNGQLITLNAVQKANAARWLHRRTRADRVIDELNSLLLVPRTSSRPHPL
jgi:hypothetical protein